VNLISPEDLADRLLCRVREMAVTRGITVGKFGPETDLLTAGILDSMGFVELLMVMETEYGYRIDLAEADPVQFSTIEGLCDLALSQSDQWLGEPC